MVRDTEARCIRMWYETSTKPPYDKQSSIIRSPATRVHYDLQKLPTEWVRPGLRPVLYAFAKTFQKGKSL